MVEHTSQAGQGARAGTALYYVNVASGQLAAAEGAQSGQNSIPICYAPDFARDGVTYACAASSAFYPGEVHIGRITGLTGGPAGRRRSRGEASRPLRRLTVSNPELESVRFAEQSVIRWPAADGLEIDGILIKPLDYRPGQRYPLVVLPHGGPEGSVENGWLAYPGQLLAARGFVAFYPNYRGSAGRGVAFAAADHRDMAGKEFDDVLAGIDHLDQLGLIDSKRVGMGGWSYGGYFSAWAGTRYSDRFAAVVMGAGISNWISYHGACDIPDEWSLVHWTVSPYDAMDLAWQRSPLAHAGKSRTPMLILHGGDDPRVPVGQAWEMYRVLQHRGVTSELVIYPREGHSVREYSHWVDVVTRFLGWFERYLGPASQ